jgi:hypothetical protein
MPGVVVSDKVAIHSFTVTVDEVVLRGHEAGVVLACAREGLELFCFVAPMVKLAQARCKLSSFAGPPHSPYGERWTCSTA